MSAQISSASAVWSIPNKVVHFNAYYFLVRNKTASLSNFSWSIPMGLVLNGLSTVCTACMTFSLSLCILQSLCILRSLCSAHTESNNFRDRSIHIERECRPRSGLPQQNTCSKTLHWSIPNKLVRFEPFYFLFDL